MSLLITNPSTISFNKYPSLSHTLRLYTYLYYIDHLFLNIVVLQF